MPSVLDHAARLVRPRIVRFGMVGLCNTALDFFLFTGLVYGMAMAVPAANVLSYGCGILNSFILNRRWTFEDRAGGSVLWRRFVLFLLVNVLGLIFSTLLVTWLSGVLPEALAPEALAKALSVPLVFVWNYAASRHIVFAGGTRTARVALAETDR